ncbi:MAG: UDP-N-acetylmuramate dehydrogenase [Candidatus Atribacteria bacterium]|nr:UDP-N-acetylmuramate dehydrogenase [Candidatus Atribacteria bacterium]
MQEKWESAGRAFTGSPALKIISGPEMKFYTTWKIGGKAVALVDIVDSRMVPDFFLRMKEAGCRYKMLGKGSNILVDDEGFPGVVVRLSGDFSRVVLQGDRIIESGAGTPLCNLVSSTLRHGLGGCEFLVGIPGTVGGAILVNAGCFGQEIGQLVSRVQVMDPDGTVHWLEKKEYGFFYRGSSLKRSEGIILRVVFSLVPDFPVVIREKIRYYSLTRKQNQPVRWPSAGSVFKNPPGFYAARIIEDLGFKGLKSGGAQISEKHSNFIVNLGGATSRDVISLIDWIRTEVLRARDISLENEIEVWQ